MPQNQRIFKKMAIKKIKSYIFDETQDRLKENQLGRGYHAHEIRMQGKKFQVKSIQGSCSSLMLFIAN